MFIIYYDLCKYGLFTCILLYMVYWFYILMLYLFIIIYLVCI